MINCEHVARSASDYLEQKLGVRGRFAVWTHLMMCKACKTYVEQIRLARFALGVVRSPAPDERQVNSALDTLRREKSGPRSGS